MDRPGGIHLPQVPFGRTHLAALVAPFLLAALAAPSVASSVTPSHSAFPVAQVVCVEAEALVTAPGAATPSVAPDSTLGALYASGVDYAAFLGATAARRAQWLANSGAARIPADVLATARGLMGRWRLLVVAVDSCSDSVNTIPYLAALVAQVPGLEMRVVLPGPGKPVMEAHRTPDGRPATPTVVVLDAAGREAGCWVERPAVLQADALAARRDGRYDAFQTGKQAWYDADAGASTVREVVAVLAAAAAGTPRCDTGAPPASGGASAAARPPVPPAGR